MIRDTRKEDCSVCEGTGAIGAGSITKLCSSCHGKGHQVRTVEITVTDVPCNDCGGGGVVMSSVH